MAREYKTNVMRILDKEETLYQFYFYFYEDGLVDGTPAVYRPNQPVEQMFKTLTTHGTSKNFYVLVIPVEQKLDLEAAAQSVSEKPVEMIHISEINQITDYTCGGCSPIDMKKQFRAMTDESCLQLPTIIVSGGKIDARVELPSSDLISLIRASTAQLCKQ